jgi:hypothetical protein
MLGNIRTVTRTHTTGTLLIDGHDDVEIDLIFEPTGEAGEIHVERGPEPGTYVVGYLVHDEDASHLVDTVDPASEDRPGGRSLFALFDRDARTSEAETAEALFERLKGFLPEAEGLYWSRFLSGDDLDGAEGMAFFGSDSPLIDLVKLDVTIWIDGDPTSLSWEDLKDLKTAAEHGWSSNEVDYILEVVGPEVVARGDRFDVSSLKIILPEKERIGDYVVPLAAALASHGAPVWPVECYEHGLRHYSIANTHAYPDRQWDVRRVGFYMPPQDVVEEVQAGTRTLEGAHAFAQGDLEEFTNWCNGSVFGVVTQMVRIDEAGIAVTESDDSCWGFVGMDHARASLAEAVVVEMLGPRVIADDPATASADNMEALANLARQAENPVIRLAAVEGIITQHEQALRGVTNATFCGLAIGGSQGILDSLDCRGLALVKRTLSGIKAEETDLSNTRFQRCTIDGAMLQGARLAHANWQSCDLSGEIDLRGADLSDAVLPADLSQATLLVDGAVLDGAMAGERPLAEALGLDDTPEP